MSSKKRKLFEDMERSKSKLHDLQTAVDNCCLREVAGVMSTDQFLSFAAFKLGFNFVYNVVSAINVVPAESGPWRLDITKSLVAAISGNILTVDEGYVVEKLLQTSVNCFSKPCVDGTSYHEIFTKIMKRKRNSTDQPHQKSLFAGCIAPPVKYCLVCQEELKKHNNPTHITYYLPEGPLPILKVELRCRTCQYNYGITKYGNKTVGYRFYKDQVIVEASDVVYIDRLLMTIFTNLRYLI